MEDVKDQGDEELYAKLDAAYSSDEEDMEVSAMSFYRHACRLSSSHVSTPLRSW